MCPCCGFRFDVTDDDRSITYDTWRQKWIDDGMPWRSGGDAQPLHRNYQDQLNNLIELEIRTQPQPNLARNLRSDFTGLTLATGDQKDGLAYYLGEIEIIEERWCFKVIDGAGQDILYFLYPSREAAQEARA